MAKTPKDEAQELAHRFCTLFLQLMRLQKLYDVDNVNLAEPLAKIQEVTAALVARYGAVRIQSEEGMIFFNKEPLRGGRKAFPMIQALVTTMDGMGVAELVFAGAVAREDVKAFVAAIRATSEQGEESVRGIQQAIDEAGIKDRIQVNAKGETTSRAVVERVQIDERSFFPLAFARTLVLLREYVKNMRDEELSRYLTQKMHRAVQEIVALTASYFNRWLRLTAVRTEDDPEFNHMACTGILCVLLGYRLGFGKVQLSDLGLAGMLHGIGRFRIGEELWNRAELDPVEQFEYGKHPYLLLASHLESRKVSAKMLVAATVGFQFDLHKGKTPVRIPPAELHPYCHIVRVCEHYTWLTTDLKDRAALLPDQAMKAMIEAPPGSFDPVVLTMFVNMMGMFPTGSVVSLSTGEVAVVVHPNPDSPKRPLVAVVLAPDGTTVDGDFLDLGDPGVTSEITGSVDPHELGLNIPDYLMS
ncbi:MAG: hypothetical protein KDD82_19245 [Planctomycetes bacterium]|nr:hypothetical protein [Planctomycetota bacterium]